MASALVREMLNAGIHFGNQASNWNPKMKPYIYGKRNSIHIIDIRETLRGLLRAQRYLTNLVAGGADVLFVGTKRQARDIVAEQAQRCGMPYVTERWLGGTLTNFRTIRLRLQRLEELENLMTTTEWETGYSKKMKSTIQRELKKIQRNLSGIRTMTRLPAALVVVDTRKEHNAVREAQALKIPTICLLDTDGDPDFASIPIPGNDDGMRAIGLVISKLADAVEEGKRVRPAQAPREDSDNAGQGARGPRRSRRGDGGPRPEVPMEAMAAASGPAPDAATPPSA